jgi:hypothetical protein
MRAFHAVIAILAAGCARETSSPGAIARGAAVQCGPGTTQQGNECIYDMLECGPGTHVENGVCVLDAFQMRIDRSLVADGTANPVLVFGLEGAPPGAELVFGVSRPDAGSFMPAEAQYNGAAFDATFVVCDASMPGCAIGPVQLTVALKSAPATILGRVDAELIAPTQIGSFAPCASGGNVLFAESEGFVYKGAVTIEQGTFTPSGDNQHATVEVVPAEPAQGTRWTFDIATASPGTPLATGVYVDAIQFASAGHPTLSIQSHSTFDACLFTYQGAFQVHDVVYTTSLDSLSVSFRQWCGLKVVSGCIHLD